MIPIISFLLELKRSLEAAAALPRSVAVARLSICREGRLSAVAAAHRPLSVLIDSLLLYPLMLAFLQGLIMETMPCSVAEVLANVPCW
jgi:hypothetical protein